MSPRSRRRPFAPDLPVPQRPFRDSAIFYGVLSALIVVFAWVTGGGLGRAILIAATFFVVATAWSWWRFRARLVEEQRAEIKQP